jgi:hypothetical protein
MSEVIAMKETTEEADQVEATDRLSAVVAILIALVTVIGAVVAWRASVAADAYGDADYAGLRASQSAEETRALDFVETYEHYGAYVAYWRYNELGLAIEKETEVATMGLNLLEYQRTESYNLSTAYQGLFPNKFLNRDGTYNWKREVNEKWADAARERDLDPDQEYTEADRLRTKTSYLLGALTVLALALVFYTLFGVAGSWWKYVMIALGTLCLLVGVFATLYIEYGMAW